MLKEIIAKNIRKVRVDAGLTQEVFAKKVHVHKIVVSRWETGGSVPILDKVEEIAKEFDKDPSWFFCSHEAGDPRDISPTMLAKIRTWLPKLAALWGGEAVKNPLMDNLPPELIGGFDGLTPCYKAGANRKTYDVTTISGDARAIMGLGAF